MESSIESESESKMPLSWVTCALLPDTRYSPCGMVWYVNKYICLDELYNSLKILWLLILLQGVLIVEIIPYLFIKAFFFNKIDAFVNDIRDKLATKF